MTSEQYWANQKAKFKEMGFFDMRLARHGERTTNISPYSIKEEERSKYTVVVRPSSSGKWGRSRTDWVVPCDKQ